VLCTVLLIACGASTVFWWAEVTPLVALYALSAATAAILAWVSARSLGRQQLVAARLLRNKLRVERRNLLLQSTLENIGEGLSVFDSRGRLIAWNSRFCELLDLPTDAVVRRIERERGLGPWSAGVVCLEGLGRFEHGLVGDLGLVKLLRALRGRPVEGWETAELLEPYGEWAGLASVYLLTGYSRGLIPLPGARAA